MRLYIDSQDGEVTEEVKKAQLCVPRRRLSFHHRVSSSSLSCDSVVFFFSHLLLFSVRLRSSASAFPPHSYLGQFEIQSGKAKAGDAAKRHYIAAKELLEPLCATNVKATDLYRIQALAFLQSLASLDKTLTRRR